MQGCPEEIHGTERGQSGQIIIDKGVPVVKETSGGNVTHPPPNSN